MLSRKLALITALLLSINCLSARAALLDFSFVFNNSLNGGGFVEGIIRGLFDNTADQAASSVEVTVNDGGFGIGEYVGNPEFNTWAVSNGVITSVSFTSYGALNADPAVTDSSLRLTFSEGGLTNSPDGLTWGISAGPVFKRLVPTSDVPSPATLALFGLGLLGLGWSRRKTV
jgi:hypothetical protein